MRSLYPFTYKTSALFKNANGISIVGVSYTYNNPWSNANVLGILLYTSEKNIHRTHLVAMKVYNIICSKFYFSVLNSPCLLP